jgi:hypothetical protein
MVHGGDAGHLEIKNKTMKIDEVVDYLHEVVKQLTILALEEPVLISDLKLC